MNNYLCLMVASNKHKSKVRAPLGERGFEAETEGRKESIEG